MNKVNIWIIINLTHFILWNIMLYFDWLLHFPENTFYIFLGEVPSDAGPYIYIYCIWKIIKMIETTRTLYLLCWSGIVKDAGYTSLPTLVLLNCGGTSILPAEYLPPWGGNRKVAWILGWLAVVYLVEKKNISHQKKKWAEQKQRSQKLLL